MPSRTFFTLFNEAYKLDLYDKRAMLTVVSYPHMNEDGQEEVKQGYALPDDLLSDIVESEKTDDISLLREALGETETENGN